MARSTPFRKALLALAVAELFAARAHAQITTDGTLAPAKNLTGPNFAITANLGRQMGSNLFHSFSAFNLSSAQSATFSGPTEIANVISRVTGPAASNVDGTIRSSIAGANLFLINPRGILFGPNASLDLTGSFHASSADFIKLGNGGRYDASNPGASVLTAAAPEAFGFLSASPAPINVQRSQLSVPAGSSLSLVGGALTLADARLSTTAGDMRVVAMGGSGDVPLNSGGASLAGMPLAPLTIARSTLEATSANGTVPGRIVIRGGQLTVVDSNLSSTNRERGSSPPVELAASADLTVRASNIASTTEGSGRGADLALSGSNVRLDNNSFVYTQTTADGPGGSIDLRASGAVSIVPSGFTSVYAFGFGSGAAGGIDVAADSLLVRTGNLASEVSGSGDAGPIRVRTRTMAVTDGGWLYSRAFGSGRSADIDVAATQSVFVGGPLGCCDTASLFSQTIGNGDGGNIRIKAPAIDIVGGHVFNQTFGTGNGGSMHFEGETVRFVGGNGRHTFIDTTVVDSGNGGDINVRASGSFEMSRGDQPDQWTRMSTSTFGSGHAGSINVDAPSIRLLDGNQAIWVGSGGTGTAGNVSLRADEIRITNGATVHGVTWGGGRGGDLLLRAPSVVLESGIVNVQTNGSGNAGHILIEGETVRLVRGSFIGSDVTQGAGGRGGDITIRASSKLEVDGSLAESGIVSANQFTSSGNAGNVTIESPLVRLIGPSMIYMPANGSGNGGNVLIRAHDIEMGAGTSIGSDNPPWGTGRGGDITIEGTGRLSVGTTGPAAPFQHWHLLPFTAQIIAWTAGPGRAGDVTISIPEIVAGLGSQFTSYTFGSGDAGNITFNADRVRLTEASHILTYTESGSGNAGNIVLNIGERLEMTGADKGIQGFFGGLSMVRRLGINSSSAGTGDAGNVVLRSPVVVLDDARIQTSTRQTGQGGSVELHVDELTLRNGGQIDAKALPGSSGDAGSIAINVTNQFEISGISPVDGAFSGVNAETLGSGRGGNVNITTAGLMIDRGFVRSSTGGPSDAGNIEVRARDVTLINGGLIDAGTTTASSGTGGSVSVAATGSIVVRGVDGSAVIPVPIVDTHPVFGAFYTAGRAQGPAPSSISSNTAGAGAGGNVSLHAPQITVADGGRVSANTSSTGTAGSVFFGASSIVLDDGRVQTGTSGSGAGGEIEIQAADIALRNGGQVDSRSAVGSSGDAGSIRIAAGNRLEISGVSPRDGLYSGVNAETLGSGRGGDVRIATGALAIERGFLRSSAGASGDAGTIDVRATDVSLTNGGAIDAGTAQGSTGTGGSVTVVASESITVRGLDSARPRNADPSIIASNTAGAGAGGNVSLIAPQITVADGARVSANTSSTGTAGSVFLAASSVVLDDGRVQTGTSGSGGGGQIEIQAADVVLRNGGQVDSRSTVGSSGDAGSIAIDAANRFEISGVSPVDGAFSGVSAETLGSGRGGDVRIGTGALAIERGFLRSSAGASGDAGTIDVRATDVSLTNGGSIDAGTAPGSSGAGGSVNIVASASITVRGLDPGQSQGEGRTSIASNTAGEGAGGNVSLSAPQITLASGGSVSANSSGGGTAGNIFIQAPDWLRLYGGSITTQATSSDGGNIDIRAGYMVRLSDSEISTSVGSGAGSGGNIFIDPTFVILERSRVAANAFGGAGGNINIIADVFIASPSSVLEASSQLGLPGQVQISAPRTDVISELPALPAQFFDASGLLREACGGRAGASRLVGVGRGGVTMSLSDYAASRYFGDEDPTMGAIHARDVVRSEAVAPARSVLLAGICASSG